MVRDEPSTEMLPEPAAAPRAPAPPVATTAGLVGRTLGRFVIVEQLGRGGSGDVYRAEQPQLGRSAVIKVLRRDASGGHAAHRIERFLREAKLASKLDHPYAAHVYAFGAEPDGVLWIAMEHVRGKTIDELIGSRGPMPPHIFGPLFGRLCEVVHTAHELGIVHRDIKGSNVMVIERAGQLLPKLLDFGIAKLDDDRDPHDASDRDDSPRASELTQEGATLGSPHYMAPEQWADAAHADARSDIYSLGAVAYRCLAGHLPFRDTDRRALALAHQHRPPPPLPDRLPRSLDEVVLRALAKVPSDRWDTALSLGEAVRVAVGSAVHEVVPIFDPYTRDVWLRAGPQPLADAIARLVGATTTVDADVALRDLVAVTCRWLAVCALAALLESGPVDQNPAVRERLRAVVGRDDAAPWLELARAATGNAKAEVPALIAAMSGADALLALTRRQDDRDRARTAAALAEDIGGAAEAFRPLEPLIAYTLVVGKAGAAESWVGVRRRDRERVIVWGDPLADGEVALLDAAGRVVLRLSPFVQVIAPLPSAEPELFVLWRSGKGAARLVAAPWGFERDDVTAGERLASLTTDESDTAHDPADDRSPYPGLAAYSVEDADRFVGREREVETLANRLVRAPMLAVLGPSGAGKSSFIHAGLLPRIGESAFARGRARTATDATYRTLVMRPGRHPMHALAALPPVGGDSLDGGSIARRLRELGESARGGLVIVVDQLEELVTLCNDPDERARFAETLAAAADGPSSPVRVVVTLRDDFAGVLESEVGFQGKFEIFVLGTPSPDALRRIVVEPARRAAVTVDPRVVDDMVAEVAGRPASLPLLSFTASQLWAARDRTSRTIGHAAYLALGGVAGALSTYADQIYDSLARRDQDITRALFARLVATDGTRVPVQRKELEELPGARAVLSHLVDARLLVVREDEDRADVVEIVHECLAERWTRLARWRREDASDRALLADLGAAARRWETTGRGGDLLWRGEPLGELVKLVGRATGLTELERAFADASIAAGRRARRVRRGIVIAVIALLAAIAGVMAYLGVVAKQSAEQATTSAQLAEERLTQALIAQGRRELNDGRAYPALAYFAEGLARGADSRALRLMISVASRGWRDTRKVIPNSGVIALIADRERVVTGDVRGAVTWWNTDGSIADTRATGLGAISSIWPLADGSFVVQGRDGVVVLGADHAPTTRIEPTSPAWSAVRGPAPDELSVVEIAGLVVYGTDGKVRRKLELPEPPSTLPSAFDRDGRHLAYVHDKQVTIVDVATLAKHVISVDARHALYVAPTNDWFVYFDQERMAHAVGFDGALRWKTEPKNPAYHVAFSPTADRIGLLSETAVDVVDGAGKELGMYPIEGDTQLVALRGDELWSGSNDGTIRHYAGDYLVASTPLPAMTVTVMVLAGDVIAALSADGSLSFVAADAAQLKLDELPDCKQLAGYAPIGWAVSYACDDRALVYWGRRLLGVVEVTPFEINVAVDPASGRAAIDSGTSIAVFDAKGTQIAKDVATEPHSGGLAFLDGDHLIVAAGGRPLWRWTISTNTWDQLLPKTQAVTVAATSRGALAIGSEAGVQLVEERGGTWSITQTIALGDKVSQLTASDDRRWIVAQLGGGGAVILDGASFAIARTLEPGDALGNAAQFDPTGELVVRTSRGSIAVYDRATGDPLVFDLDLLDQVLGGRMLADGRIEVDTNEPGVIEIPIDTRPVAQLLADIACRVPLRISGTRVEPTSPICR